LTSIEMLQRSSNSNAASETQATLAIDIVICTYNRAAGVDTVLSALSRQYPATDVAWSVVVIDNASTDATAEIVDAHRSRRLLPGLRCVRESEQGLTPARRRGVLETSAPWIAFVDDDNLLEPGWLDAIAHAIRSHPSAGAVAGRVVLEWERPPPGTVSQRLSSPARVGVQVRMRLRAGGRWMMDSNHRYPCGGWRLGLLRKFRRANCGSHLTHRSRELDSNFRFRARFGSVFVISLFALRFVAEA
jgi:glycosyltransferase involved in cell wall biosynthesis